MTTAPFNHGVRVVQAGSEPRPIQVADVSTIGLVFADDEADPDIYPLNEPVLIFTHETTKVAALGDGVGNLAVDTVNAVRGQGIEARMVVVRVAEDADAEAELANFVGSAAASTGVHALSYARGHVGAEPDILVGGGYSAGRVDNAKNPFAAAMEAVATKLKAQAIFDTGGPDSDASLAYRADFSSRYTYLVDPFVRVLVGEAIVARPASPYAAAMFVKKDKERGGPYWSPSNQEVLGILGTARPISYFDGEIDHEANLLNEAGIATFIPSRIVQGTGGTFSPNGRILWGNRTASEDPLWAFVNVVRTRSTIEKAIVSAFRPWAIDDNLTAQHVLSIMRSLQDFLDELVAVGAILGGRVYFDRPTNTNASLRSGTLRVEFDAEETPPLENLIFGSRRNEAYFDNLAADIQRRISVEFGGTIADLVA